MARNKHPEETVRLILDAASKLFIEKGYDGTSLQEAVLRIVPYLLDNPRFLAIEVRDLLNVVAPEFIQPILDEGAADGSIQVENTRAMAEVLLLMIDIWVNPMIQPSTPEEVRERCRVFISMTNAMGLDVMDEEMIEVFVNYSRMRNNSHE